MKFTNWCGDHTVNWGAGAQGQLCAAEARPVCVGDIYKHRTGGTGRTHSPTHSLLP